MMQQTEQRRIENHLAVGIVTDHRNLHPIIEHLTWHGTEVFKRLNMRPGNGVAHTKPIIREDLTVRVAERLVVPQKPSNVVEERTVPLEVFFD